MRTVAELQNQIQRQQELIATLEKQVFELRAVVDKFPGVIDSVKLDTLRVMAGGSFGCNGGKGCRLASQMVKAIDGQS